MSINIYFNYLQTELQENILANTQSVYSEIKSNKQWLRSVGITVYATSIVMLVSMYWQNWSTYLTNDTRRQTQCNSWLAEGTVKFTLPRTTLRHHKIWLLTAQCAHTKTFIIHPDLSWWEDSQPDWSHIDRQEMAFECTRCMKFQWSWLWYWSLSGGCRI